MIHCNVMVTLLTNTHSVPKSNQCRMLKMTPFILLWSPAVGPQAVFLMLSVTFTKKEKILE
jgi:hypothetical protein